MELILSPALDHLPKLLENKDNLDNFDFCYIDNDKENYKIYYEIVIKLLRPGGLILFDNTLWSHKVAYDIEEGDTETKALNELNIKSQKDERLEINMIPIGDGLTIARKI